MCICFFFQAEDGIRDRNVTGVQTCALPIFRRPAQWGDTLAVRAELHPELLNGTREVVRSDGSWASTPSQLTRADLMAGRTRDLQLIEGTAQPGLVDHAAAHPLAYARTPPTR